MIKIYVRPGCTGTETMFLSIKTKVWILVKVTFIFYTKTAVINTSKLE